MTLSVATSGLVGHVGRSGVSFGRIDAAGELADNSIRTFSVHEQASVTGALTAYLQAQSPGFDPNPCVIAVAGIARGEVITITNTQRVVSRRGLTDILRGSPTIINDFVAAAWAFTRPDRVRTEPLSSDVPFRHATAETYCLIGLNMDLGVSAITAFAGSALVIPTEGGATLPPYVTPTLSSAIEPLRSRDGRLETYNILSGDGLVRLAGGGTANPASTPYGMPAVRSVLSRRDAKAVKAVETFVALFWKFAANLVLTYGAWDGVIVTGELAMLLRPMLTSGARDAFAFRSPHTRLLRQVPLVFGSSDHDILSGAAIALGTLRQRG